MTNRRLLGSLTAITPIDPMRRARPFRLLTVCLALFSMLFMQLAVAAYACPAASAMQVGSAMQMSASAVDMTHCAGMDKAQAPLCHVHADGDQVKRSADNLHLPAVPPFLPSSLLLTRLFIHADTAFATRDTSALFLKRSTAPPLAVRHCCFRI